MPPSSKIRRPVVVDLPASTWPQITMDTCFFPSVMMFGSGSFSLVVELDVTLLSSFRLSVGDGRVDGEKERRRPTATA